MPYKLVTIIVSIGGLILTAVLTLAGLILAQARSTRTEVQGIRSGSLSLPPLSVPKNRRRQLLQITTTTYLTWWVNIA